VARGAARIRADEEQVMSGKPITIEPHPGRVVVRFGGETVVDTRRALALREAGLPPVLYLPREDAAMRLLVRTTRSTRCPHKGEAAYYSIRAGERETENAVWTYEQPLASVAAIAGHLAFYVDRVEIQVETLP
jgi:uncharacterized protein (DUF427 family)